MKYHIKNMIILYYEIPFKILRSLKSNITSKIKSFASLSLEYECIEHLITKIFLKFFSNIQYVC